MPRSQDADALVRERAAGTLEYVMGKELGARDVVQHCGVSKLVVCLSDAVPQVRLAAYQALIEAARFNAVRVELCTQVRNLLGNRTGARSVRLHNAFILERGAEQQPAFLLSGNATQRGAGRVCRSLCAPQRALQHLMQLALQEGQQYLLKALQVLNACVQVRTHT